MRTESAEEFTSSARPSSASISESAAAAGKWTVKLGCYAVATVAFTFMLLRPRRAGAGNRGSLFLGSGVIVVLIKTLLSTSEGSSATPAPVTPVLAAAAPAPVSAPQVPAPSAAPVRRRVSNQATVSQPKSSAATEANPKKLTPSAGTALAGANATNAAKSKPAVSAKPVAAPTKSSSPLGPRYADKLFGYSVQFPAGWTYRPFKEGGCWVLDASDGQAAISIGFSKFSATMTVDEVVPEKVTRGLQKRAGTVVHSTGYTTIGGRRSLWHKYTGPISRPNGNARMTVVHYLLPLQDGRALELRLAAAPEKFNEIAPRMKQSIDSFKLLARAGEGGSARAK